MLSMRVTAAVLALGLVVSACGGDDDEEPVADSTTTTTEPTSTTVDDQPIVSEPTTLPPPVVETTTTLTISTTTESVLPDPDETSVAPPQPPSNVKCVGGTAEGELLVEFDALSNPESVSKIRVYVEVGGRSADAQRRVHARSDRHIARRWNSLGGTGSLSSGQRQFASDGHLVQPTRPRVRLVSGARVLRRARHALRRFNASALNASAPDLHRGL